MSQKTKKILARISFILLAVCVVTYGVLLAIFPDQVKHYTSIVWDYVNRPLPVVGVSSLVLAYVLIKIVKMSSFGQRQINEFKRNKEAIETDYASTKEWVEIKLTEYRKEILEMNEYIRELEEKYNKAYSELCKAIPNKKVNALGVKLYGEKTIDNETKAD